MRAILANRGAAPMSVELAANVSRIRVEIYDGAKISPGSATGAGGFTLPALAVAVVNLASMAV